MEGKRGREGGKGRRKKSSSGMVPVVDGGGVGLGLVEQVGALGFGGEVAAGVEHAPPHVALARGGGAGRRRGRRGGRLRHRQGSLVLVAAALSFCTMSIGSHHQLMKLLLLVLVVVVVVVGESGDEVSSSVR
ncbi:hypothetical protein GW17_00020433 [Ensete ventricosum]|nr:hypothetical protein GW17_00020433 [Ensete ventricosum]RZS08916.1 hypothetical protein BHM03_00039946 [Ensete ventricosum]